MKNVFGVVFSNMHDHMIKELTLDRCMGSLPVGGRYRLIDFILSGFSNAGITNTAVITKNNYKSLLDHLGNGREWDLARKRGGLMILPPAALSDGGAIYRNRIEALAGIMSIIRGNSAAKQIVIADCDTMANVNYGDLIRGHRRNKADITVLYTRKGTEAGTTRDLSTFIVDEENNVVDMLVNPEMGGEQNVWMNIMVIEKDLLEWVIRDCVSRGKESFERDVLQAAIGNVRFVAEEFNGYASRFDSVRTYYEANLDMLDREVRDSLFPKDRPIYTNVWDEAPVRYGLDAKVSNSLLADGCIIEGEVTGCLLSRGVVVGKGAKVKNSVLMQGTHVGAYSTMDCIVTDKRVMVGENRTIMGTPNYPMYIAKGSVV